MALPVAEAPAGFSAPDFDALGHLAPVEAARALGPKIESLLLAVNEQRTAGRIVEARNNAGQPGSKLFHRNSYHDGGNGLVYAYHHGGRWEPQFNIGFLSTNPWGGDWMRIGLGFNLLASGGREDHAGGQEGMVRYFEIFQQQLASAWRRQLADWMGTAGGFIQYGSRGPAIDLLPPQAVDWLINCHNPAARGGSLSDAGCRWPSPTMAPRSATCASSSRRSRTLSPRSFRSGLRFIDRGRPEQGAARADGKREESKNRRIEEDCHAAPPLAACLLRPRRRNQLIRSRSSPAKRRGLVNAGLRPA